MAGDVRKPPVDAQFALHLPQKRGKCRWCGEPVGGEKTRFGGGRIYWHEECQAEFYIIIRPESARNALFKRDKGICCDCGEDFSERFVLRKGIEVICGPDWKDKYPRDKYHAESRLGFWRYTELVYISLWHGDHKVPLWKVRHMAPLARLEYFKLANLITRCHECHKFKTNEEAGERAKLNEMAAPPAEKTKRSWGSRKMVSANRFPPKGSRPMRGRK